MMDDSTIKCDEIIESYNEDTDAEAKLYHEKKGTLMKRKEPVKHKIFIFYSHFY